MLTDLPLNGIHLTHLLQVDYVLAELAGYTQLYDEATGIEVGFSYLHQVHELTCLSPDWSLRARLEI